MAIESRKNEHDFEPTKLLFFNRHCFYYRTFMYFNENSNIINLKLLKNFKNENIS